MSDIRLQQHTDFPREAVTIDWLLAPDGLPDETQALATAAIVALGTDRLAEPTDDLPDPDSTDRRGWWGDLDAAEIWDGWPIGSRLWLLARAKITGREAREGSTLARAEAYVTEALQPFADKKICSRIAVQASRTALGRIDVRAVLYRGPNPAIDLRFSDLWDEIGA